MDWNNIEAMWKEARRKVKAKWHKLTDEDLEMIAGQRDRLEVKIHQRYGFAPSHVSKEVDDWVRWQKPQSSPRPQQSAISSV